MRSTFLKAGALIDVEHERVVTDAYVKVVGKDIRAWGRITDMPAPELDAKILSFPGQTLLPGLVNSHAHLCTPSGGQPFYLKQTDGMALLTAVHNMRIEQRAGITTVRDCGDQNGVLFVLRKAVENGIIDGPRLVLCGPPLTITGGHAAFLGGVADGVEEMTRAVRQRIADGADFIKLIGTGGGTPGTFPALAAYSIEEISAAVETAHRLDVPVAVHCRGTPGIEIALKAGVDWIEHACFEQKDGDLSFDPETADGLAKKGVGVTPTIQLYRDAYHHLGEKSTLKNISAEERERLKRLPGVIEEKYRALEGFLSAGVRLVAGNDAGLPYTGFGCLWQELEAMITGGMTAMGAICAATLAPAKMLGFDHRIGSIQKGKQADLMVVDGDPTTDITVLSRVSMVMQSGRVVTGKSDGSVPLNL